MNKKRIFNILSIIASIIIIYVSIIPEPWWHLEGGENGALFSAFVAPSNMTIKLLGETLDIPAMSYGSLTFLLIMVLPLILNIIGNIFSDKNWGKALITMSPGIFIIVFPILLYLATFGVESFINIKVPVIGETIAEISLKQFGYDVRVLLPLKASFTLQYWIGFIGGILLIVGGLGPRIVKEEAPEEVEEKPEEGGDEEEKEEAVSEEMVVKSGSM